MPAAAEKAHGRFDLRELKVAAIDAQACGFPHARQVILATRWKLDKATGELVIDPKTGKVEPEVRYFITSLDVGEIRPESLARNVRDHWAVENKNHWRRDASQWREDACRLRNPRSVQNFGLLRNALLAIIPRDLGPLAAVFLHYARNISAALKLLNSQLSAAT